MSPPFTGVGVALVTVFDERGEVDSVATAEHAARVVDLGVRAVIVAGTTGEVDALDDDERLGLFAAVRERVPAVPVIAGTGATSARKAAALTKAAANTGVDAVLARTPRGVDDPSAYYAAVAEAAGDLPVLGYHFPAVAPPGIPVDLLGKLPIAGCKDSSGSADRLLETLHSWSGPLYVGSPALLLMAGRLGAAGAILALANSDPEVCMRAFDGDADAQRELTAAHLECTDFPRGPKRLVRRRFGVPGTVRMG